MKTTSQKKSNRLPQESKLVVPQAQTPETPKQDNRLPIDIEARKHNRTLPTEKVLALLKTVNPDLFNLAEVVGKWVWVQFKEQPTPSLRQQLAQIGFHWNRERQAWQHPCGAFRLRGSDDPHEKYQAYRPAEVTTN